MSFSDHDYCHIAYLHIACTAHMCCSIHVQKDEVYLNLVLDFVPETVYRVIRHHSKAKQIMPVLYTKVN